jgi:hypothetical protein
MRSTHRLIPALCLTLCLLLPMGAYATRPTSAAVSSPYKLSPSAMTHMHRAYTAADPDTDAHLNGQAHAAQGIPGVDSVPTFNGHFHLTGYTSAGTVQSDWYTNTVGHMPGDGGTTTIGAPLIPVSLELLDQNGNQAYDPGSGQPLYYDITPYIAKAMNSPLFQNAPFSSSSTPTQYTDAIQRAEYYNKAPADWHTMLAPRLLSTRVLRVPYGYYYYLLNGDGTCCSDVFVEYNWTHAALKNTIMAPAINDGSMTQQDITSIYFPNVFLYVGSIDQCCIGGYHSYLSEPASPATNNLQIRWVYNWSGYYAADVLGYTDHDIYPLSHELAESFNDPYVGGDGIHNIVPVWTDGYSCSRRLEVADAFAGNSYDYPITLNGYTYHPVNVALLQWFEGKKSDAVGGAYSYPDTTAMTSPMVPQNPNSCP